MNKAGGTINQASVPMKFFATWEIDKSAANCIPRVCTMTICKLTVLRELDKDVQSIFIAVKMQGSKRIFRSNEIVLLSNGLVDTPLDLTFSLEYPHFVKRDENKLQILLQRKKRYKNRAMLGYKSLAVCRVDMGELIQCPFPSGTTLHLIALRKDHDTTVSVAAHLVLSSMNSVPLDADVESDRTRKRVTGQSPEVDNYSDDDDDTLSSDPDLGSDNLQAVGLNNEALWDFVGEEDGRQKRKNRRKVRMSSSSRQQNFIKTKIAAMLKKFRQVSVEGLDPTMVTDHDENPENQEDYDFLYDELEDLNLSDSCPEIDNISIVSTPKPKLKPFFDRLSHSSSQAEIEAIKKSPTEKMEVSFKHEQGLFKSNSLSNRNLDESQSVAGRVSSANSSPEIKPARSPHSSGEKIKNRSARDGAVSERDSGSASTVSTPKETKTVLSQTSTVSDFLTRLENEDGLPEIVLLVDGNDKIASLTGRALTVRGVGLSKPVITRSNAEVQTVFAAFLSRLQKYLTRNSLPLLPVKFAVIGSHVYLTTILQTFVNSFSARSSDWQSLLLFYVIPTVGTRVSRYLSSIDARYGALFGESIWKEGVDKLNDLHFAEQSQEFTDVSTKLKEYIAEASQVLPLAIAEAMITFRQRNTDEDKSSQKFLPFIAEVRVGETDVITVTDSDKEDCPNPVTLAVTNVPTSAAANSIVTPPSSPSVPLSGPISAAQLVTGIVAGSSQVTEVKIGLQVDYWKDRDAAKYSLKSNFKSFHVTCLPILGERAHTPALILDVVTKGKKNIMRLPGKKGREKDADVKSHAVSSINRLICTSKHQNNLLHVSIDGVEYKDVKFFQLSAHWSTHVKSFPIAVF